MTTALLFWDVHQAMQTRPTARVFLDEREALDSDKQKRAVTKAPSGLIKQTVDRTLLGVG